jgi:hypothetical protein
MTPRFFYRLWKRFQWKEYRGALPISMLLSWYAEVHRNKEARELPFTLEDFLVRPDGKSTPQPETKVQTVEEMIEIAKLYTDSYNRLREKGALTDGR